MASIGSRDSRIVIGFLIAMLTRLPAAAIDDAPEERSNSAHGRVYSDAKQAEALLTEIRRLPPEALLASWQVNQILERRRKRFRLDVEPFVAEVLRYIRDLGLPLRGFRDPLKGRTVGITANFSVGEEYPGVAFHLADRTPDALTAFYGNGKGLSWAFVWPVGAFTMRLEGGKRSEFGSLAIAGAQWNHPTLPLAIGVGIPMRLRNAEGEIGIIFQVRAKLR